MADFAVLKERVSIEQAAQAVGLELKPSGHQLRGPCPACGNGGPRALVITPNKEMTDGTRGAFYCFSAGIGGDLISMWGHVQKCSLAEAGKQIAAMFTVRNSGTSAPVTSTPVHSSLTTPPAPKFNADAFASKLVFTEEVAALGFDEETAQAFGIGHYRGHVYLPVRYPSGVIAGWYALIEGKLKVPKEWLPDVSKVVQLHPKKSA